MKKFLTATLLVFFLGTLQSTEKDSTLTFSAPFDNFSANAAVAAGNGTAKGLGENDLQLRMFPGVGSKSNALVLSNSESCQWDMFKNFNPAQATISFWVRNINWNLNSPKRQILFYADRRDLQIRIWKVWQPYINVSIMIIVKGKPVYHTLAARLDPAQWSGERWHRIDLAWDTREYKLYIDGKLPPKTPTMIGKKATAPTVVVKKFAPGITMPGDMKGGVFGIGLPARLHKHNFFSPEYRTAFNKLKIYNRMLSGEEIFRDYSKYVAPEKLPPNVISVPTVKKKVTLDGKVTAEEWADAENVLFLERLRNTLDVKYPISAKIFKDQTHLYLAFSADRLVKKTAHSRNDGPLWEDDSFEFHLQSSSGKRWQFILNSKGALYDSCNTNPAWNSGAKAAARLVKEGWEAELMIPLKSLDNPTGPQKGNFTYSAHSGLWHILRLWSNQNKGEFAPDSIVVFPPSFKAVQLKEPEKLASGIIELSSSPRNPLPVSVNIETAEGVQLKAELAKGKIWKNKVNDGIHTLYVTCGPEKSPMFRLVKRFAVRSALELTHNANPLKKIITVELNLNNAENKVRTALAKGLNAKLTLLDPSGKKTVQKTVVLKKVMSSVILPFPDKLYQGNWKLQAEVSLGKSQLKNEIPFRVPDLRPYTAQLGKDDTVPEPWVPVQQKKANVFTVLDRTYTFDGSSPFPRSVISRNTETLARQPELLLNKAKVRWQPFKVTRRLKNYIALEGSGKSGNAGFKWKGELWFDGMYKLELQMSPAKGVLPISQMSINYATTPKISLFALNPLYMPWKKKEAGIPLGPAGRKDNLLWLCGREIGFASWVKSNANWVNKPGEKVMCARQNSSGGADVELKIITRPAKLSKTADYTFVFMATPPRRPTVPPRSANAHGYNFTKNNNYQSCSWGGFYNPASNDDNTSLNSLVPAYPEKWKKSAVYNKRGKKVQIYSMPGHLADTEAAFDYLGRDLQSYPPLSHSGTKLGRKWTTWQYCGNASSLAADLWCWNFDTCSRIFKGYDYDGIYFDIGAVRFCSSKDHGCAGTDAFGNAYISSDALGLRNFFMRVYKTVKKHKGTIMLHSHVQFVPFVHDFGDMFSPGENTFYQLAKNLKYGYLEEVTKEEYQTDFNWRKAGVAYQIIAQTARAAALLPGLKHMEKEIRRNSSYTMSALAAFSVHDLNLWASSLKTQDVDRYWGIRRDFNIDSAADYIGYWNKDCAISSGSEKVYCGYYYWNTPAPYKYVFILSNFNRNAVPLKFKADWNKLKLDKSKIVLTDLWNKRPVKVDDLEKMTIPGASFMLIGVK